MKRDPAHILQISGDTIELDMNMDVRDFAQARLTPYIEEKGWIAIPEGSTPEDTAESDIDRKYRFEPWGFSETRDDEGFIRIVGHGFHGTTLLEILDTKAQADDGIQPADGATQAQFPPTDTIKAVQNVCDAIEAGILAGINIPQTGPAGTLVGNDGKILFLPETLFIRAAESRPQVDYSNLLGCWTNPGLEPVEALRFTEAVYAYRAVSGNLPFPLPYTERRHADYYDHNFIPLELAVSGVDTELAKAVNRNLSRQGAIRITKRNTKSVRVQRNGSPCVKIPAQLIQMAHTTPEDEAATAAAREIFSRKQEKRVRRIRFVRKHNTSLKVTALVILGIVCAIGVYLDERQDSYTPKGLTSRQLCETLYTGIDTLDVSILQSICKGRGTTALIDSISSFYVTTKVRESTERDTGTFPPAQWLYMNNDRFWIFGVTNLEIDGKPAEAGMLPYIRRDKPEQISSEDGRTLSTGDTVTHTARYYFVHNGGANLVSVDLCSDEITLEYRKDHWIITRVNRTSEHTELDLSEFKSEYAAALEQAGGSVVEAADTLRTNYSWLPDRDTILEAAATMYDRFTIPAAAQDLGIAVGME